MADLESLEERLKQVEKRIDYLENLIDKGYAKQIEEFDRQIDALRKRVGTLEAKQ